MWFVKKVIAFQLLRLFRCPSCLVLPPSLNGIRRIFGVKQIVPPPEAAGIVANEFLMVKVMVVSTSPEREEMVKTPGKLVTAVRINGLEQAQHNPHVHGEDVQVSGHSTPKNRTANSTKSKNHNLDRRCIFSCHAKWRRVLMVNLMDCFVKRTPVKGTVREVVPCIFQDEKDRDLVCHRPKRRERNRSRKTKKLSHRVEQPSRPLATFSINRQVIPTRSGATQQWNGWEGRIWRNSIARVARAFCAIAVSHGANFDIHPWNYATYTLNLVVLEHARSVYENPRQRTSEINKFVHHKRHDTGGQHIILHPCVPRSPHPFGNIQMRVILRDSVKLAPIRIRRCWE